MRLLPVLALSFSVLGGIGVYRLIGIPSAAPAASAASSEESPTFSRKVNHSPLRDRPRNAEVFAERPPSLVPSKASSRYQPKYLASEPAKQGGRSGSGVKFSENIPVTEPVAAIPSVPISPQTASPLSATSSLAAQPAYEEVVQYAQGPLAADLPADLTRTLPATEQSALKTAREAFEKQLAEYGPLDPNSEDYYYAYQESSQASDDILRAYLGWDRYMALSAAALSQTPEQLATERAGVAP